MTFRKGKQRLQRSNKGTGMAEVALGTIIMTAMSIFSLDVGTVIYAYSNTDRACRDAARAAAQGTSAVEAMNLARAILKDHAVNSGLISAPRIKSLVYDDLGGNPPPGVSPTVTVTTTAIAKMPAPITLLGSNLGAGSFTVAKEYTFPIVKLKL